MELVGFPKARRSSSSGIGALLVLAGMCALIPVPAPAQGALGFLRGDANADGVIDVADAVSVLLYLFGGSKCDCLDAADVNGTGEVDISDPIWLLSYLFRGGPPPASPYPKCAELQGAGASLGCSKPTCVVDAEPAELVWLCRRQECRQCEPCGDPSLEALVKALEAEGIEVYDSSLRSVIVIALCGAWTGIHYAVLVDPEDAAKLAEEGWSETCPK